MSERFEKRIEEGLLKLQKDLNRRCNHAYKARSRNQKILRLTTNSAPSNIDTATRFQTPISPHI